MEIQTNPKTTNDETAQAAHTNIIPPSMQLMQQNSATNKRSHDSSDSEDDKIEEKKVKITGSESDIEEEPITLGPLPSEKEILSETVYHDTETSEDSAETPHDTEISEDEWQRRGNPNSSPEITENTASKEKPEKVKKPKAPQFVFDDKFHRYVSEDPSHTLYSTGRADECYRVNVKLINALEKGAINGIGFGRMLRGMKVMHIRDCRKVARDTMCVIFDKRESANKFVQDQRHINERGYKAEIPIFYRTMVGVLKNIPIDISAKEMHEELTANGLTVTKIERMTRKLRDGGRDYSLNMKIFFAHDSLPRTVKAFFMIEKIHAYISPLLQCDICWRFGHNSFMCKAKSDRKCSRCGSKSHSRKMCGAAKPTCIHCNGNHEAYSRICPERIRRDNVKILMSTQNITASEALEKFPQWTSENEFSILENMRDFPMLSRTNYRDKLNGSAKTIKVSEKKRKVWSKRQPERFSNHYSNLEINVEPQRSAFVPTNEDAMESIDLNGTSDSVKTIIEAPTAIAGGQPQNQIETKEKDGQKQEKKINCFINAMDDDDDHFNHE